MDRKPHPANLAHMSCSVLLNQHYAARDIAGLRNGAERKKNAKKGKKGGGFETSSVQLMTSKYQ
ncbi:MAG: hypothetical protein AAF412_10845 [Pseudomonadota bacterium]